MAPPGLPLPLEAIVAQAVTQLYLEQALPRARLLQYRVEQLLGMKVSVQELRLAVQAVPGIRIEPPDARKSSFMALLSVPPHGHEAFADGDDDPIASHLWPEVETILSAGGWQQPANMDHQVFVVADYLRSQCSSADLSFGKAIAVVRQSMTTLKILGKRREVIVPYKDSEECERRSNASQRKPTGVSPGERYVSEEQALRKALVYLLEMEDNDNAPIAVSRLKTLFRERLGAELTETAFGCLTLAELLAKLDDQFEVLPREKGTPFIMQRRSKRQQIGTPCSLKELQLSHVPVAAAPGAEGAHTGDRRSRAAVADRQASAAAATAEECRLHASPTWAPSTPLPAAGGGCAISAAAAWLGSLSGGSADLVGCAAATNLEDGSLTSSAGLVHWATSPMMMQATSAYGVCLDERLSPGAPMTVPVSAEMWLGQGMPVWTVDLGSTMAGPSLLDWTDLNAAATTLAPGLPQKIRLNDALPDLPSYSGKIDSSACSTAAASSHPAGLDSPGQQQPEPPMAVNVPLAAGLIPWVAEATQTEQPPLSPGQVTPPRRPCVSSAFTPESAELPEAEQTEEEAPLSPGQMTPPRRPRVPPCVTPEDQENPEVNQRGGLRCPLPASPLPTPKLPATMAVLAASGFRRTSLSPPPKMRTTLQSPQPTPSPLPSWARIQRTFIDVPMPKETRPSLRACSLPPRSPSGCETP
eukprot:TRINITY_DN74354_c0_g1_i1.p1 TRINITY_DN74354_c0_g1~~TRINITY_DN74354_c0_g1_i1.p1  ORF type:complete len:699 (-),score=150.97 TRINITY_DN74354_c0_g1_i1:74-2170(-)